MSRAMTWWIVAVGLALLVVGLALAGFAGSPQTANAAATLALVTATAVGIERVLEIFWVVAGQLANSWWPLDVPAKQLDAFISDLNRQVTPFVTRAQAIVSSAEADAKEAVQGLDTAKGALGSLRQYLQELSVSDPPTQAQAAAMIAAINSLVGWDTQLAQGADEAKTVIADLSSFASTFMDNPARKLISLYLGALIGLLIAAFSHLDLFRASGIQTTNVWVFQWGVALTGVVMGLGSNPAHEVIKAVQEFKNNQKQSVLARPPSTGGGAAMG
jgi:hypothetical protein